jgi:CheY-like chemotaxis protein
MTTNTAEEKGHTVLVVEDEEDLREMVRDALELNGYGVVTARDGREAMTPGLIPPRGARILRPASARSHGGPRRILELPRSKRAPNRSRPILVPCDSLMPPCVG